MNIQKEKKSKLFGSTKGNERKKEVYIIIPSLVGAGAGAGDWASTTMANIRANMSTTPITTPLDDEEPKHTAILIETQTQRDMKMRRRRRMICELWGRVGESLVNK